MGIGAKGLLLAVAALAGCTPFPGDDGGPANYVSYIAFHFWGQGRTTWSIDENDRVSYVSYDDSRLENTPPKATDVRRSVRVDGAYQTIVDLMEASEVKTLKRFCIARDAPDFEIIQMPTDVPYTGVEWVVGNTTYRFSNSFFMCEGGSDPALDVITHRVIAAIESTVEDALGIAR